MKAIKYLLVPLLAAPLAFLSCEKNVIEFPTETLEQKGYDAEFQLHYVEAIDNKAVNYIDSVFVNGTLYSSVKGSGSLQPYGSLPSGRVSAFFAAKSGPVNLKLYRKGAVVYEQDFELLKGKQNVFVYALDRKPVVVQSDYPYRAGEDGRPDPTQDEYNTDSVATIRFCNFLFEADGQPYQGKLQYQWKNRDDEKDASGEYPWKNIGGPVGFGEVSERAMVIIHKDVFNSSGYQYIDYRIVDESGKVLRLWNSRKKEVDYSDYWRAYIGRGYMHIFAGNRMALPAASVRVWTCI